MAVMVMVKYDGGETVWECNVCGSEFKRRMRKCRKCGEEVEKFKYLNVENDNKNQKRSPTLRKMTIIFTMT